MHVFMFHTIVGCLMHNFDYSLNNSTTQQLEDLRFQPEVPIGLIYNSVQLRSINSQRVVQQQRVNEKSAKSTCNAYLRHSLSHAARLHLANAGIRLMVPR